jgi:preprotein translocase subunit YajC
MERMSSNGKNVIIFSMEMGENALAQRIDSISTLSDINRMYTSSQDIVKLGNQLKANKTGKGSIIIKEFPTGQASTAHFRSVLREYQYRGITFDAIFCDYITIMMPEYNVAGQLYQDGKRIAEELRALSLEFLSPCISVSQLNRCLGLKTEVTIKKNDLEIIKKINELKVGDEIKTENGFNIVKKIYPIEKQKVYEIKTENGKTIRCSKRHLFPCFDDNDKFIGNFNIMYILKNELNIKTG